MQFHNGLSIFFRICSLSLSYYDQHVLFSVFVSLFTLQLMEIIKCCLSCVQRRSTNQKVLSEC